MAQVNVACRLHGGFLIASSAYPSHTNGPPPLASGANPGQTTRHHGLTQVDSAVFAAWLQENSTNPVVTLGLVYQT
jgi:hypothetical protein